MPDASERIRIDAKAAARPKPRRFAARLPTNKRVIAGAALAAMMIGIVVNALALQHGRRVDLGLPPDPAPLAAIRPSPAPVAVAPAKPAPVVAEAEPPPRPPVRAAPKSADAIADLLRTQSPDRRKLTLAAQGALAKLGFTVKATGALDGETRSALLEFEKSHRLPASTEITAKLVHTLKTAAQAE